MLTAGAIAVGARLVAVLSGWARDLLVKRGDVVDGRSLCLRMLAGLHRG